jgi:TPR repeat protein
LYYLGLFYEHGFGVEKSPKRAINYYLKASEVNYAPARNKMGDCYFSGFGIPMNR